MDSTEYFFLFCHMCMWPSQEFSRYKYDLCGWLEAHVQASIKQHQAASVVVLRHARHTFQTHRALSWGLAGVWPKMDVGR